MAKKELFEKNKLWKWLITTMGAFPVERGTGDLSVINTSIEKLEEGRNLVIFPEGTRSKDGKVGIGKTGVALVASTAKREVIPVGIVFEGKLKFRSKVIVKYGKAISTKDLCLSDKPTPHELKEIKLTIMKGITDLVEGEK